VKGAPPIKTLMGHNNARRENRGLRDQKVRDTGSHAEGTLREKRMRKKETLEVAEESSSSPSKRDL